MILSDHSIKESIADGRIVMTPYDESLVQPASIDIRLDGRFRVFRNYKYSCIDPKAVQQDLTELIEVGDEPFIIHPGEFILGNTVERIKLGNDLVGRVEGKALALDTPIPTPAGWKTMGDLQIGDRVFHPSGCPVSVVAATEVLLGRPCYRLSFSGGDAIVADAAHEWFVSLKSDRKHNRRERTTIATTEQIAQSLRYGKEWNYHIPLCRPVCLPERILPVDPYVLGIWLGDGTSTQAVLTCADEQILEEIVKAGYEVAKLPRQYQYRLGGCGHTRDTVSGQYCRNSSLSSTLRTMGQLGNKHVPREYLHSSIEQRLSLLQGLMDADGFSDETGRCEFSNMNPLLTDAVAELAASLGFRPSINTKAAKLYGVDCGTAYQVKFSPDRPVFRLKRKRVRQVEKVCRHNFRAITAVDPMESAPVRCVQVSAPDGLFLAGKHFIPTHNSSLGRLGLIIHATAGYIDPGFDGNITLELSNVANLPIRLYPGMKVGQISFFAMSTPADRPYGHPELGSKYKGQIAPTASRMHLNFAPEEDHTEEDHP